MRRSRLSLLSSLGLLLAASPLLAAPADEARTRIDGFRELGASFKTVNDAQRGPEVQTILLHMAARQIVNASKAMPGWFPPGSGAESGAKTRAKPDIWRQAAKFKAAQDAFARQAVQFQRAAQAGLLPSIKAETRKLGQTCKGCHDSFRMPGK